MFDQELYNQAQRRVDRRNRRHIRWYVHLTAFLIYIGIFLLVVNTSALYYALFGLMVMVALFVLHTSILTTQDSRDNDIEQEAARLRAAFEARPYEKPKRLELGEDGELVEAVDEEQPQRLRR